MQSIERWRSKTGRSRLRALLTPGLSTRVAGEIPLRDHEALIVDRAIRDLQKRGRRSDPRARARAARALADELDILQRGDPPEDLTDRLSSRRFRGKRDHLLRLLASLRSDDWNRWRRRSGAIPDLRGAPLYDLDLREVDLTRARLQGAELSGANVRTGMLRDAKLMECSARHADFSYADLRGADLSGAELAETLLTGADLSRANLRRAYLIGTFMNRVDLRGSDLREVVVWGVSTWNIALDEKTRQGDIAVVSDLDPAEYAFDSASLRDLRKPHHGIQVNGFAAATFMAMLFADPRIDWIINSAAERIVLLLGRFTGRERDVLQRLRDTLLDHEYVGVIFDFEASSRDLIEAVTVLAGLSNFVIANLSDARSVALESLQIIQNFRMPFVPILRRGEEEFAMFEPLRRRYDYVLKTVRYRDADDLVDNLERRILIPVQKTFARLGHDSPVR